MPSVPVPPKSRSSFDSPFDRANISDSIEDMIAGIQVANHDRSRRPLKPKIREKDGYEVSHRKSELKHLHSWRWQSIFATFARPGSLPVVMRIRYKITAGNMISAEEGELRIHISN